MVTDSDGKNVADLTALSEENPALLVDRAERAPERALLHLLQLMRERRGHLLLVSRVCRRLHWRIELP
jgi:hypothetical protein